MRVRHGVALLVAAAALVGLALLRAHSSPPFIQRVTPATLGTTSLITEPSDGITPLITAIENASSSVDLVMYQLEDPQIEQALAQGASRGVSVRVLLNGGYYGKKENTDNDAAYQYFQSHNVAVHWAPSYFALTHQKTLIVDDDRGYIMTLNFTPQYYASSRDFALVDTDTTDVSAIEAAFDDDWNGTQATAPEGDDLVWSPGSEASLIDLIEGATSSLDIYNEEMADPAITQALEAAAARSVTVRVDMTYSSEWKSAFTALTQSGVQVRTYAADAPLYIHAKLIIADDARVFLGSENFSSASLEKNRELGITLSNRSVISSLETTFQKDWAAATPFQH